MGEEVQKFRNLPQVTSKHVVETDPRIRPDSKIYIPGYVITVPTTWPYQEILIFPSEVTTSSPPDS